MQKIIVSLGCTLQAYCDIEVEIPDNASKEEIATAIRQKVAKEHNEEGFVFDPDYSTQEDFRVVAYPGAYGPEDVGVEIEDIFNS